MLAISGVLYPPLQYVSAVDKGGAAYEGGVRLNDRILEVNEADTRGAKHEDVVEHVLRGGDNLVLKVLRVSLTEAERLALIEKAAEDGKVPDKVQPKISVKGFEERQTPKRHTVYKIYYGDEMICVKRYSEFDALHKKLTARFRIFTLPPLPPKKLNGFLATRLSSKETVIRRQKLHEYLVACLSIPDIKASPIINDFLDNKLPNDNAKALEKDDASVAVAPEAAPTSPVADDGDSGPSEDAAVDGGDNKPKAAPLFNLAPDEDENEDQDVEAALFATDAASGADTDVAVAVAEAPEPDADAAEAAAPTPTEDAVPPTPPTEDVSAPAEPEVDDAEAAQGGADVEPPTSPEPEPEPDTEAATDTNKKFRIFLVDGRKLSVQLPEDSQALALEKAITAKMELSDVASCMFGLFEEITDGAGEAVAERKILPAECPAQVAGRLMLRKWLFAKKQEERVDEEEMAIELLYIQAKQDIERGRLVVGPIADDLAALETEENKLEYVQLVRKLRAYAGASFRPCPCDYPEADTLTKVTLGLKNLSLQTCDENGVPSEDEEAVVDFNWNTVTDWKHSEGQVVITYEADEGESDSITFKSSDSAYLFACVERIMLERSWMLELKTGEATDASKDAPYQNYFA